MKIMVDNPLKHPINYRFPFLIETPYTICLGNDISIVNLTHKDMNCLREPRQWLCDSIVMSFLHWMTLQSNKIAVVDSLSHLSQIWDEEKKQNLKINRVTHQLVLYINQLIATI